MNEPTAPHEKLWEPPPLESLQRWMQAVLIQPLSQSTPPASELPPEWQASGPEALIRPSKRLTPRQHLAIYQRSYHARLRDCMRAQFSALEHALGAELFQAFADQFLQQYPSNSHSLADLGARFPQFLEQTRPEPTDGEAEPWPEFMIELARFEYSLSVLFDAAADASFHPQAAAATGPNAEGATGPAQLNPLSQLYRHPYPLIDYYRRFTAGGQPELPLPAESYAIVVRHHYRLGLFDLQPVQYDFLRCLSTGDGFSTARQRTIDKHQLPPQQFDHAWSRWQQRWFQVGVLVGQPPIV